VPGTKVKELTIDPKSSLSMQKHRWRAEYWFVSEGSCQVEHEGKTLILHQHDDMMIPRETWHRLSNPFDQPCKLIEIQFGERCEEQDIERHS
jgi:mannose-1-phosphate guanylyltransferase/mannose-6-phosphate isomerase